MLLTVELHDDLQPLTSAQWQDLFGDHPDPPALIKLSGQTKIEGYECKNIIVRRNDRPVLSLPVFAGDYPLSTTMDGSIQKAMVALERFFPLLLRPKILAVGFLEGEWGQAGLSPDVDDQTIAAAWRLALQALENLARELKVQATVFWNFTERTIAQIPQSALASYCQVNSPPFCQLVLNFPSIEDYLLTLPKDMRRYLERILRRRPPVTVELTQDVEKVIDRLYALYVAHVLRAKVSFGIQPKEYFASICRHVPGAIYMLYRLDDELIGFDLAIDTGRRLVSKYFAMDPTQGRQHRLYFLSWLEQVQYCLDRNIPLLYLGGASEGLKVKMGAQAMPSVVAFRHRNPLIHHLLWRLRGDISYEPEIPFARAGLKPTLKGIPETSYQASTGDPGARGPA